VGRAAVPLSLAQLSVDVRDASGHRVGTVPPPVPRPGDDRLEPLSPGASRTFVVSLNVFSPPLPPVRTRSTGASVRASRRRRCRSS